MCPRITSSNQRAGSWSVSRRRSWTSTARWAPPPRARRRTSNGGIPLFLATRERLFFIVRVVRIVRTRGIIGVLRGRQAIRLVRIGVRIVRTPGEPPPTSYPLFWLPDNNCIFASAPSATSTPGEIIDVFRGRKGDRTVRLCVRLTLVCVRLAPLESSRCSRPDGGFAGFKLPFAAGDALRTTTSPTVSYL